MTRWLTTGAAIAGASYATYVAATWLRYGHTKPARGDARDERLDAFMPRYEIVERHAVRVDAPPAVTLAAARALDLGGSRIVRGIFRARELLLRARPDPTERPRGLVDAMRSFGWSVLGESDDEIVLGAATRPWEANPVFRPIPPAEFAAFAEPGHVKIAWTLRVTPTGDGGTTFRTETRAIATDPAARRRFRRYWALLSPGIIVIRIALLRELAAAAERAWRLEGDDLVPDARAQLTHAITIAAPPADVWAWLVQMGCQRAGWYSWDFLDNGGKPSADHIIPELQHLAVGDVLPARPSGAEGFKVLRLAPERALVLAGLSPKFPGTWAFVLEPLGPSATRLVTRYRASYEPSVGLELARLAITRIHAFMEGKQLRTIKHHAEHMHPAHA